MDELYPLHTVNTTHVYSNIYVCLSFTIMLFILVLIRYTILAESKSTQKLYRNQNSPISV